MKLESFEMAIVTWSSAGDALFVASIETFC